MLNLRLCDYSDASILVSGTIIVAVPSEENNGIVVVFKNCTLVTNCISEISNTQIDNVKYINVVTPMYNLREKKQQLFKHIRRFMAILWR